MVNAIRSTADEVTGERPSAKPVASEPLSMPHRSGLWQRLAQRLRRFAWPVAVVAFLVGTTCLVAMRQYGSMAGALARLQGHVLHVEPRVQDLGVLQHKHSGSASFKLSNLTDSPIVVVGATTTCGCFMTERLPLTVAPGETQSLEFNVTAVRPRVGNAYEQIATLHLDTEGPPIRLGVKAIVADP
jgi:hypothetical protein